MINSHLMAQNDVDECKGQVVQQNEALILPHDNKNISLNKKQVSQKIDYCEAAIEAFKNLQEFQTPIKEQLSCFD
ncbi:hypothetical protein FGO68_gene4255 [Halteria grandinella]|uniref:Uncharacterized protein n=1 Tax=Halteria grandinella TaxID=5974 RepID=A0A8J8T9U0_HALGN|nr:hypothetical protein FGO68_gene4255 [Halteria grandinella]